MIIAQSKVTAQGQISVPADVRKKLGIGPGAILEWEEEDGAIVVRRAGRHTSADIHRAIFRNTPKAHTLGELKAGIRDSIRGRHARD